MNNQRGTVFFYILIGVALFAALSYAVSQSIRLSSDSSGMAIGESEKGAAQATSIIQWGLSMKDALVIVKTTNGCNVENISEQTIIGNPITNPGPCNLFDSANGGGATYKLIKDGDKSIYASPVTPSWPGTASLIINTITTTKRATLKPDIVFIMMYIKPNICMAINKSLGIVTSDGQPPLQSTPWEGGWNVPISNTPYSPGWYNFILGQSLMVPNELQGHGSGCYRAKRGATDDLGYHFYMALYER